MKDYYVAVSDITFYLYDEDGNAKTDKSGNEITYRLKDGIRFKPLEYIADGVEVDMLQKIKRSKNAKLDRERSQIYFKK
jgi:hypothetical protein